MKLSQGISKLAMLRDHGCYQSLGQRTARERVKRFAERVAPVAQTTHPSQAGLARVLNSLVVPPFLRRGNWQSLRALFCAHKPHHESGAVFLLIHI